MLSANRGSESLESNTEIPDQARLKTVKAGKSGITGFTTVIIFRTTLLMLCLYYLPRLLNQINNKHATNNEGIMIL